ncbi:MAG: glycosyl hydrolase 53 family protein, partial [Lachnospiraceae bacterium]|nr:glycosyl hydrolase 53 family protein [Lachnospiraceae bacterium]
VNAIRLRLWNEPENVPQSGGYCSLRHTLAMARRIKAQGMSFLLDFHYSDFWADPGQQKKPRAWENLTGEALEEAVYTFTKETLEVLKAEGVMPDMVQIGNEIRSGLLFPDGELPNVDGMVRLVNAGIRGARAVAGEEEMQIMIHLDQGGRYLFIKDWFDKAFAHGLEDFDIIGLSYYPFWHGTFMDLKQTMEQLVKDFGKPIIVAETAHAWCKSTNGFIDEAQERIAGIPATPQGQKKVLDMVMNIAASLPDKKGMGMYYWEPLCVPKGGEGGWCENMGILQADSTVMEAVKAFLFTRDAVCPEKPAKVYEPAKLTIAVKDVEKASVSDATIAPSGERTTTASDDQTIPASDKQTRQVLEGLLPTEVSVLYYDGTLRRHAVVWDREPSGSQEVVQAWREGKIGSYEFRGSVCIHDVTDGGVACRAGMSDSAPLTVTQQIDLAVSLDKGENLIQDSNWDNGFTAWQIEKSDERVQALFYPEMVEPFPAPPINALHVEAPMNFRFTISQKLTLQSAGDYRLSVYYRGVDTTNVDVRLFMQVGEECKEQVIHPTDDDWTEYIIEWKDCPAGEAAVGIKISSPPVYGM